MKNKKLDVFGIGCGLFLVAVLIVNIVLGNINAEANRPKIPATAQTYATSAQGIFSEVKVETIADADGVYSVKVVEHGETPELGGVAAETLPAAIVEAQSVDVDGVAGATMTSNAIKAAVTEALVQAGFMEAPVAEEPEEEPAVEETAAEPAVEEPVEAAAEGGMSYTVSAPGVFGEPVELEVVADAEQIYSVTVTSHNETEGIGSRAVAELPGAIVAAQSVDVDGVAGATMTSNAIKTAVADALAQAGFGAAAGETAAEEEPTAEEAAAEPAVEEPAGAAAEGGMSYTVSAPGVFGEPVELEVVADAEQIYSVTVTSHNETQGIGSIAVAELPGKIVDAQSVEVDGVAGATMTSNAIKTAVADALAQAGFGAAAAEPAAEEPAEEPMAEEAVEEAAAEPAVEEPVEAAAEGGMSYTVSAPGVFGEPVELEVVADAEQIYSVTVTSHNETQGIGSIAVAELPGKIVDAQSVEVDGVAGATMTSNAIKTAVSEALVQAGFVGGAAPAAPAEEVPAEDVTYDVDVVVVGAGGAGLTAAITANDAGVKVLVLESQGLPGGNSVRSTGGMNAAKTEWADANEFGKGNEAVAVEATLAKVASFPDNARIQELGAIVAEQWAAYQENPEGYFDTVELFQLDTLIGGGGMNDPALVKTLAENSEAAIEWLGSLDPQVILHNVAQFGGASVKRIHRPVDEEGKVLSVGAYVVPLLRENLESRGIELLLSTTATEILVDETGKAVGVVAMGPSGETVTVNAKAVVITTGGFGANNDMIASVRPDLDGFITTNAPGIQGQGIQMAQAIGADTVDLEQIQLHPTVHVEGPNAVLITEGLRGDGAILVNQDGLRFFDEVSTRDKVSAAEFEQPGGYAWLIVDSRMADASNVIQGYINKGYAETGESYEALAEAIGAPADVFAATMETWNACVEEKADPEFGRVSFASPLDQAPYYAIKVQPGIHHTMGGIKIDSMAQVINTEGNVIEALFAAGEVTGGVHGNNRLGGNAVADFTIFGRIAGQSAADYVMYGPAPMAEEEPAAEEASEEVEGEVYTAAGESMLNFENVYVTITVVDGKIVAVDVDTSSQSTEIGWAAEPLYEEQILAANGAKIDGVSGATLTSMAVQEAYAEVLKQAGIG